MAAAAAAAAADILALNIGGRRFAVLRSTVRAHAPHSMLARLGANEALPTPRDADGAYFFDRDGDAFMHVLAWLREQRLAFGRYDEEVLRDEFAFWCIDCPMLPRRKPRDDVGADLRDAHTSAVQRIGRSTNSSGADTRGIDYSLTTAVEELAETFVKRWYGVMRWQARVLGTREALVCMHNKTMIDGLEHWHVRLSRTRLPHMVVETLAKTPVVEEWLERACFGGEDIGSDARRIIADVERTTFEIGRAKPTEAQIDAVAEELVRLSADRDALRNVYVTMRGPFLATAHQEIYDMPAFVMWRDGIVREHINALCKDRTMRRRYFPKASGVFRHEAARDEWTRAMARRGLAARWMRGVVDSKRSKNVFGVRRHPVVYVFEDGSEHTSMRGEDDVHDDDGDDGDDGEALRATVKSALHGVRHDLVDVFDRLGGVGHEDRIVWLCRVSWAQPVAPPPTIVERPAAPLVVVPQSRVVKRRRIAGGGGGETDDGGDNGDGIDDEAADDDAGE